MQALRLDLFWFTKFILHKSIDFNQNFWDYKPKMNDTPNLVKELSPECNAKLQAAIAAGATHAKFTYADGSYHAYPIREINRGLNAHRRSRLGLELVKVVTTNEKLASLPFWNSFVDDREINPN